MGGVRRRFFRPDDRGLRRETGETEKAYLGSGKVDFQADEGFN
jgi:hypothetical protein